MTAAIHAVQTEIPHDRDVDDLVGKLTAAYATLDRLVERIEQLETSEYPETIDELLAGAAQLLRRIPQATGPIEPAGAGTRNDVEQLTATALAVLADAQTRLTAPF